MRIEDKREELKASFGATPEIFRQNVYDTLSIIEEEKPVKRFTMRTVLVMVFILFFMAGVALAISGSLGVLDFIQRDTPLSEEAKQEIQTEFTQQEADLGDVTARVRDAVSDGRTLFVSIEYKTKDPEDALLDTRDGIDWDNEDASALALRNRTPESLPDLEAVGNAKTAHYTMGAILGSDKSLHNAYKGYGWRYETPNTIVYTHMFDLDRIENRQDVMTFEFMVYLGIEEPIAEEDMPPGALPGAKMWKVKEEGKLTVEIKAGTMERKTAVATVPFIYGDFEVKELEITATPLATYVRTVRGVLMDFDDRNFAYFNVCDENGTPFVNILDNPVYMAGELESTDDLVNEYIYAKRSDLPDTVILRAIPFLDERGELPEDLAVGLVPKD